METLRAGAADLASLIRRKQAAFSAALSRSPHHRPGAELGQGLAEYALILAFIAIVAIAALAFFGVQLSSVLVDPVGKDFSGVVSIITP
jgi:Flp pilus assembly pilin Flp